VATNRTALQRFSRGVRRQVGWTFAAFGIGFGLALYYREELFALLLDPSQGMLGPGGAPVFVAPTEMFSATIRLAISGGIVTATPMVMVGVSRVMIAFLLPNERRFIFLFFIPTAMLCAVAGVVFAYFVLLPVGLGFLLNFGANTATPMIRISEYMSLATTMVLWMGLAFELPLVMYVFSRLQIVSYQRMKRIRKYVPWTAILFGIIITPTMDGTNMLLVAVPLWALYEVGLVLAWLGRPVERRRWSPLRLALVEAVIMAVLVTGVVGILWYAGVLGGNG
jgi:sec-independent protein translocase protein TatC